MNIRKDYLQLHFIVFLSSLNPTIAILITIPAVEIVLIRVVLAIIILGGFLLIKKMNLKITKEQLWPLLLSGLLTGVYWVLLVVSAKISNASVTLVGMATSPLWVTFIMPFYNKQRIDFYQAITGINATFGIYMIQSANFEYGIGLAVAILAAVFGALSTIISSRLAKVHNHLVVTYYQMFGVLAGIVLFLPIYSLLMEAGITLTPTWSDLLFILLIAFFLSVYAYSVFIKIMKTISPFTVALTTNLSPVYGIVAALIINGTTEKMNLYFYSGATIIVASVIASPLVQVFFKESAPENSSSTIV